MAEKKQNLIGSEDLLRIRDEFVSSEREEKKRETTLPEEPQQSRAVNLMPPNTATVGRSVKLRDLFTLSGCVDVLITAVTVVNTTVETDLWSFKLFPNEWHTKMVLRFVTDGIYSTANGSDTFTLKLKLGSVTMLSIVSSAASVTDADFYISALMTVRAVGSGSAALLEVGLNADINEVKKSVVETTPTTFDSTASQTLSLTATWSNADAGDTVTIEQGVLEILN